MSENAKLIHLSLAFRNTNGSDAIRSYVNEKLMNCLQKFVRQDTEAHVVLSVEKNRHIAEVKFRADGADFIAQEESSDLYASIDALVDTITKQLRRHKEKIKSHH